MHSEFLRVCLKVKARREAQSPSRPAVPSRAKSRQVAEVYHLAARLLDQPIFDISASRLPSPATATATAFSPCGLPSASFEGNSTGNSSPAQLTPQSLEGLFVSMMRRAFALPLPARLPELFLLRRTCSDWYAALPLHPLPHCLLSLFAAAGCGGFRGWRQAALGPTREFHCPSCPRL